MSGPRFFVYRRQLPHWRHQGAIYFVTWRLRASQPVLEPSERSLVVAVLRHSAGVRHSLHAYVVMDDHVHVLTAPRRGHALHQVVHSWKSYSASRLQRVHGRRGAVWQDEYHDRIVRDERAFRQAAEYVVGNPGKRWPGIDRYRWVFCEGVGSDRHGGLSHGGIAPEGSAP